MLTHKVTFAFCCALLLILGGCSRQQSDWQKTRETNTTDAYEQFLKKYPSGEFVGQAQARLKEMYEERDWQKARDADTADAYQAFLKQYPEGKWTEEARIRVENFTLAPPPSGPGVAPATPGASAAAPSGAASGASLSSAAPTGAAGVPPTAPSLASTPTPREQKSASKVASGTYAVQLGAFKSGTAAADKRWEYLQKQYPTLLAGLSAKVVPKKTTSGTLYRLRAIGVSESHARMICKNLKAKSQPCVIVRPTRA